MKATPPSRGLTKRGPSGMRIGVIGTGHVGLVTCAALATLGHHVIGTDLDLSRILALQRGIPPFFEPGLEGSLASGLRDAHIAFTSEPADAIKGAELTFICVGTPPRTDGEANLSAVERAARDVARHAPSQCVIVEKSTVPAGTADRIRHTLLLERSPMDLHVVSNPEFLREGHAIEDALHPDRIVVGADSPWAFEQMRRLYKPLLDTGCRLIETDIATAEISKHASNAFLALRISYANALARICERAGADVVTVTKVMGADPRIGSEFLQAGMGYGGSCFPKDLRAFERLAEHFGYRFGILSEIARINDEAVCAVAQKVRDAVWNLEGKTVGLLGLSFKPGTDDTRYSPALALGRLLVAGGADVVGYDPQALPNAQADLPEMRLAMDPYEAARGAHCIVVCTEWPEFLQLDLAALRAAMAYPVVVDGRNVLDPKAMAAAGFDYFPTGRPAVGGRQLTEGDEYTMPELGDEVARR